MNIAGGNDFFAELITKLTDLPVNISDCVYVFESMAFVIWFIIFSDKEFIISYRLDFQIVIE